MGRQSIILENSLNEYVYSLIMAMTNDQKKQLPEFLYKKINTANRAANFCHKSSTDQKRELLSYLGVGFFWTFAGVGKISQKEYVDVLKEFKKDNTTWGIKTMIEKGVYVTMDKNYVWALERMAQSTQTGVYSKNLEVDTAGRHIKNWPKRLTHDEQQESEEMLKSVDVINKMIAATLNQAKYIESGLGLKEEEMKVLLHFDSNRNQYISYARIKNVFLGSISSRKLSSSVASLLKSMLIQKHVDWRRKDYTITKMGIRKIHEFRDKVLKSFNF